MCFGSKIRKIGIPLNMPYRYIKVGFKGIYISRTCFPDVIGHYCRHSKENLKCLQVQIKIQQTSTIRKILFSLFSRTLNSDRADREHS